MENASKALLIAGGVLLAMMIISVIVYMSGRITEMGEAQENRKAAQQLAAFNSGYEAYNKQLMYGTDVITVINKAKEDGGITIVVKDRTGTKYPNLEELKTTLTKNVKDSTKELDDYEGLKIFKCTDVKYSKETGKVNYMEFQERN